jgi:lysophospholipase L1-like esterase
MLRAAVFLAVTFACSLAPTVLRAEDAAAPTTAKPRFEDEIQKFEAWDRQNSPPRDAVLFAGSSSIRLWQTAESFPDLPVINRGFGGSTVADVNRYAERIVLKYEPRVIVFYAGDNDIAGGKSPQQVFDDTRTFIDLVHSRLPNTHIIYLPIKPSLARWAKWTQMQEANALMKHLDESDSKLEYADLATPILGSDGKPRPELFREDGLHLNDTGYRQWNELLRPVLQAALKNP